MFFCFVSDQEESETGSEPVHYRRVFLDDEDADADPDEREGGSDEASFNRCDGEDASSHHSEQEHRGDDQHHSEGSYHYSDDHENYSDDSERDADTTQPEAGE